MRRFSSKVAYDPATDCTTWGGYNPALMKPPSDPLKLALMAAARSASSRRNVEKVRVRSRERKHPREAAEEHVAEVVRSVVGQLEAALQLLNGTPAVGVYHKSVSQKQLHNAVIFLRNKCGVKFEEDSDFVGRIPLSSFR